ncbi:hypothetical protein D3C80_790440 [compost metagenome]
MFRVRSNWALRSSLSRLSMLTPGRRAAWRSRASLRAFWWLYITWNSGLWLRLRSGCNASTSCSKGRS